MDVRQMDTLEKRLRKASKQLRKAQAIVEKQIEYDAQFQPGNPEADFSVALAELNTKMLHARYGVQEAQWAFRDYSGRGW